MKLVTVKVFTENLFKGNFFGLKLRLSIKHFSRKREKEENSELI